MKATNTKMKLLSLAILGLGGLVLAGSAAAQSCPDISATPWSTKQALSTGVLEVTAGGLDASSCKLDAKVTGAGFLSAAYVQDDSPSAEPSYRAQFLINVDNLTDIAFGQYFTLFKATSDTVVNNNDNTVQMNLVGPGFSAGPAKLSIATACDTQPSGLCSVGTSSLQSGANRIEVEWVAGSGANGIVRVWINNGNEAAPDYEVTNLSNGAWGGVDMAWLGMVGPTTAYQTGHANQVVSFDTFDSRRATFIGN